MAFSVAFFGQTNGILKNFKKIENMENPLCLFDWFKYSNPTFKLEYISAFFCPFSPGDLFWSP